VQRTVTYWIVCLVIEDPVTQCYEWQKKNMNVRNWTMELKKGMCNRRLAFVWMQQQECNLKEITKMVKDRCNDMELTIF